MARIEITATVTGTIWKTEAEPGAELPAGSTLVVIESMKMEIPVTAPQAGTLVELRVAENDSVDEGQVLAVMEC